MNSKEYEIERLIKEKLCERECVYVHFNGTEGKILVRVYGNRRLKEPIFYEKKLFEELGPEEFANMVVFDITFS